VRSRGRGDGLRGPELGQIIGRRRRRDRRSHGGDGGGRGHWDRC
jgi:hypothetical protein